MTLEEQLNRALCKAVERAQVNLGVGVELRDWLAGQAMLIAGMQPLTQDPDELARWTYQIADAMLRARGEKAPALSGQGGEAGGTPTGVEDWPIKGLDLTSRALRCLDNAGVRTVRDLMRRSRADLLKIRGLGRGTVAEIERELAGHGVSPAPTSIPSAGRASKP